MSQYSEESIMFLVSEECVRLGLRAGVIVFRGLSITESPGELREELAEEVKKIRERFSTPTDLRSTSAVATLHSIFRSVGVNPRKVPPACQRLMQLAMKRGDLPRINNLVDAYNLITLRYVCSLGAHDLDALSLPVSLRLLRGDETFTRLGNQEEEPVAPGEFAYVDAANHVICRLDVVQCEFSKVTDNTGNALLIVGGTIAHSPQLLRETFSDAIRTITKYCGGEPEVIYSPS